MPSPVSSIARVWAVLIIIIVVVVVIVTSPASHPYHRHECIHPHHRPHPVPEATHARRPFSSLSGFRAPSLSVSFDFTGPDSCPIVLYRTLHGRIQVTRASP